MLSQPRALCRFLMISLFCLCIARTAVAQGYSFTKIADTSGTFLSFGIYPAINTSGQVTFIANLRAGGSGVYLGSGGAPAGLATTNGPYSAFSGSPSINDSGT